MSLVFDARVTARDFDVAFEVGDGETVALLGPNGAGKSTVLGVTAGLLHPDDGEVVLGGRTLTGRSAWVRPHRREVALLAQEPLLFPHLTALENVAFGPRSKGVHRREARARAQQLLAKVGVGDLATRRPVQLSGGQAQRVAVARALAAEPHLLLLDEPMAALDVEVTPALRQMLREVLRERSAVIATHDVLDALLLADRVVVLDQGRVVEQGPSHEVLSRPRSAFAARIAGLNMVAGTWDGGVAGPVRVEGQAHGPAPAAGDRVVAVFRPNAVSVYLQAPGGSPRNTFHVVVTDLEPRGDQIRVRAGDLSADITPQAVAELDLVPGARVVFSVKATEVAVYRT